MSIGLNEYTFRLNDTGVTLNTDSTLPFVDIEKVVGLDNAPYRETMRDHEGTDGGFMDAEFEKGRDVILNGIIYADTSNVETYLDSLKANYAPVQTPIPFYLKAPGVSERVIFVKPRGVRYDWETARRIGVTDAQFLMYAEDPRIYDSTLSNSLVNYGGASGVGLAFSGLLDTFSRVTSSGWGTANSGHTYTLTGTAADFSTDGTSAKITLTAATGTAYFAAANTTAAVNHYFVSPENLVLSATPTGGTISVFHDKLQDSNNYYRSEIIFTTTSTVQVALIKVVAGTPTTLVSATTVSGATPTGGVHARFEVTQGQGSDTSMAVRAKVWQFGTAEPVAQTVEAIDTSLTGTGTLRVGAVRNSGNTNTNPVVSWNSFQLWQGIGFNLDFGGGAIPSGATLNVSGNRPTPVVFVITGPIENPIISNTTSGHTLAFTITLTGSDTLTVDTLNRTVYFNGNSNRRNTLTTPDWFFLDPGVNQIFFGGQNGSGSTLSISYRAAWR